MSKEKDKDVTNMSVEQKSDLRTYNNDGNITLEQLIEGLKELFSGEKDGVVVEDVHDLMDKFQFNALDFQHYCKWESNRLTRNLVHEGNSKFNLILMCWAEAVVTPIHDHSNSHCFMRILEGAAVETRYYWPEERRAEDGSLLASSQRLLEAGQTAYMSDELGLHRVANQSRTQTMMSLHVYSPPFQDCNILDEKTRKETKIQMIFYSKFGKKMETQIVSESDID